MHNAMLTEKKLYCEYCSQFKSSNQILISVQPQKLSKVIAKKCDN